MGNFAINPYGGLQSPEFTGPGGTAGLEEVDGTNALSPNQYEMLMKSMQDPLAMYSASLPSQQDSTSNQLGAYNQGSLPNQQDDLTLRSSGQFDPLQMYRGQNYNISPTYATLGGGDGGGHGQEEAGPSRRGQEEVGSSRRGQEEEGLGEGDESHPMFAMMSSTYQPRPPATPRSQLSRTH